MAASRYYRAVHSPKLRIEDFADGFSQLSPILGNWLPYPRRAPLGVLGLTGVVIFLVLSVREPSDSVLLKAIFAVLLIASPGLCLLSLLWDRSKLYGYLGVLATVAYIFGTLTCLAVAGM